MKRFTKQELETLKSLLVEEAQRMDDDGRDGAFDAESTATDIRQNPSGIERNQMKTLAIPSVHLNGTARADLLEGYCDAIDALHAAGRKLAAAYPNGRDYYVQPGNAIGVAMAQHEARMLKLREVISELEEIAQAIADGETR